MSKKFVFRVLIGSMLFSVVTIAASFACSDFVVKARDNSIINGRSMEFPVDLHSAVVIVPRGREFTSVNDKGVKGISWTNKYGFLGINAYNLKDAFVDGFNEKGLAFGALMFTGAQCQEAVPGKFVAISDLGSWIMGNFASVDEVKEALPEINVARMSMKEMHGELYFHVALHDASGKNLVIEFIDGKVKVYDNPVGVLTNRPEFPWQLDNLRNYVNLDSHDKNSRIINGLRVEATGVGSGMLGLPGDWTPPSRFVRLSLSVDAALPVDNAEQAVNLAQHLLAMVDIPKGVIKESPAPFVKLEGYAQWVVIKDLTNRVLYYKTYENTALKKVDLKRFDLSPGTPECSIVIEDKRQTVIDISGELK